MTKIQKSPSERGLTASTDTRIVRREYTGKRSSASIRIESITKEKELDPKISEAIKVTLNGTSGYGLLGAASSSSSSSGSVGSGNPTPLSPSALTSLIGNKRIGYGVGGRIVEVIDIPVELVIQQAWYGPYGDKEWHDLEYVDLVPEDKR